MPLVRHGTGPVAGLRAAASQVHPVFMLPAVASSLFGAVVAHVVSLPLAALHASAIFLALYTAHVKDGYVDFHVRGEDDDHPMTVAGCRLALVVASVAFAVVLAALWSMAGPVTALLTAPGWLIAYFHAPQLDVNPVTATAGYPTGIVLAMLGGYHAQADALAPAILGYAAVFLVTLLGVKIIDDATDVAYDRSIGKTTVAVALGTDGARRLAFTMMALAMVGTVAVAVIIPTVPIGVALTPLAFGAVATVASSAEFELATMLLIRGAYVFLAAILLVVLLEPLG